MNMKTLPEQIGYDPDDLKEDIHRLLKATSEIADEAVVEARKRLRATCGKAGEAYEQGAKHARAFVKGHACETATLALLAGVALGYLLTRRHD